MFRFHWIFLIPFFLAVKCASAGELSLVLCNEDSFDDQKTLAEVNKTPAFNFDDGDVRCLLEQNKADTLNFILTRTSGEKLNPNQFLDGQTRLLTFAISHGSFDCGDRLLDNGASAKFVDAYNLPMHELVKVLNRIYGTKRWRQSAYRLARHLIDKGIDLMVADKDGATALQAVIPKHNKELIEILNPVPRSVSKWQR